MSALQIFNFQSSSIRVATDDNNNPWFVAKDVAEILGYESPDKAYVHCKQSSNLALLNKINNLPPATKWIPESDVYRLIMRSNKPNAEVFQDLVCEEILPTIRKTGSYSTTGNNPNINMMLVADNLEANIKIAKLFGFDGNQALLSANKATKQVTGIDCMALHGIELIAPTKDKFVTPTELGKQLGLSGMKVNLLLAEKGYQVKHGKNWHLTLQGKDLAILQDTNKKHSDGTPVQQIKWSQDLAEKLAA